jgi:hypothetical protein
MDPSSHEAGLVPELVWILWGRKKFLTCREPIQDNKIKQERNMEVTCLGALPSLFSHKHNNNRLNNNN